MAATALMGLFGGMTPADAAAGDTVAAVVTGFTRTDNAPPPPPATVTHRGSFGGVVITGVFVATDSSPQVYSGDVSAGTITFETTENLAVGRGTIDNGSFSGGPDANGCTIEGNISDGEFERVGTVAVAGLDIEYEVTCGGNSSRGEVRANVVVTAVPGANPAQLGNLADAEIVGTVVGEGSGQSPHVAELL